jgi:predicted CDP-diglyceride synthetase/phosphatidate cytidylyltransferase
MWNVLILWIALSAWILTLEMFSDLIIFELVSCVLSVPLNDDIMMYKNKDISTLPAIQWGLKHEATALSCYLKTFEETHRAVEVVKHGLLTHRKYSYTRELPDAIVTVLI